MSVSNSWAEFAALSRNTLKPSSSMNDPGALLFASNFALDRLSRYEATLWRQAGQILYALDSLDRRKPQEKRGRPFRPEWISFGL